MKIEIVDFLSSEDGIKGAMLIEFIAPNEEMVKYTLDKVKAVLATLDLECVDGVVSEVGLSGEAEVDLWEEAVIAEEERGVSVDEAPAPDNKEIDGVDITIDEDLLKAYYSPKNVDKEVGKSQEDDLEDGWVKE